MILTKKDLYYFLKIESRMYNRKNRRIPFIAISESQILWKHQALLRYTEYYANNNKYLMKLIYLLKLRLYQNKYSLHIPLNTCDIGLRIMHLGPVLLNGNCKIGKYVALHIGTALVAGGMTDDAPVLGDYVVVGVGAKIVGGVYLANYIAVGANAVVTKSFFEENIAIAGVPAKKVSNNGNKNWMKAASLR